MNSLHETEVLVVGAGPAGTAAAIQLVRLGHSVILADRTGQTGGLVRNAFEVQNSPFTYPPASGQQLALAMQRHLSKWDIPVLPLNIEHIGVGDSGIYGG